MVNFNVILFCRTMFTEEFQNALSDVKRPHFNFRIADCFFYHNKVRFGTHPPAAPIDAEPVANNSFFNRIKFNAVFASAIAIHPYIFKNNKKHVEINF